MAFVWYLVLLAALALGLLLSLTRLGGNWVMLAAAAGYGYLTHWAVIGWPALVTLGGLAVAGEVFESTAGSAAAKRAGASGRGNWGAFVGGFLGGIFLTFLVPIPIVGSIIGVCLGAFLGAMIFESAGGRDAGAAARVGVGAAHGTFVGILTKIGFGLIIFLLALIMCFPVSCHRATPPPSLSAPTRPAW